MCLTSLAWLKKSKHVALSPWKCVFEARPDECWRESTTAARNTASLPSHCGAPTCTTCLCRRWNGTDLRSHIKSCSQTSATPAATKSSCEELSHTQPAALLEREAACLGPKRC